MKHSHRVLLLLTLSLSGCAYPTRNEPALTIPPPVNYSWKTLPASHIPETVVIVTASGGGTRAAALELSVLRAMNKVRLRSGDSLADNIDILSAVSGGSVTAAYFALHGPQGFDSLETNFIRRDGIGALVGGLLNPVEFAKLNTPSTERIDLLIDYFNKSLFKEHETFAQLMGRRPFLILNAADMAEGIPFAFTQNNFSLLCSDLSRLPLSVGVAASAAFPVALSPVTLKDYSPCEAQKHTTWPPAWVEDTAESDWKDDPEGVTMARVQQAYALGGPAKGYIHLLDGGIADNLGLAEPYRILTTNAPSPSILNAISDGRIKKIVVVMINARSAPASDLGRKPDTPGIIDMLLGTIDSSIDRASAGSAFRLREALRDKYTAVAADIRADTPDVPANRELAAKLDKIADNASLVEIDFDAIPDPKCRLAFHSISTSWTNTKDEIDSILQMGEALFVQDSEYLKLLIAVGGSYAGTPPTVQQACDRLAGHH